ncbi:tyrosyl-DNA phosphodiesterase I [Mycena sp. CBHHK59/15]|nr:tyrosyl-DNA phosphodiesterase I [Mycena sp. CBHHK59/15]
MGVRNAHVLCQLAPNISSPPPSLASRTFYNGGFFPTSTIHANPRNDRREAISLADILGSSSTSDLKLAIISSYGLGSNPDWLYQHFNPSAPVILVVQTGSEEQRATMTKNIFPNWVQTCPKLGRGGCLHMKYMLLFYKTGRLRVVVSTANLLSLDWKHLENSVFLQDICLRSAPLVDGDSNASGEAKQLNANGHSEESFAKLLESVLKATNVVPALEHFKQNRSDLPLKSISDLSKLWDWSRVKAELVPSIAGKWEGWKQIKMTGHPRLMRAIETLGLTSGGAQKLVVECQGSSIGNYTTQWFNQFYLSASGQSSALKAHLDISEAKRKKLAYPSGVKVIFPTLNTVKNTDQHGSGSLFCKRKQWDAKNFPRDHFYDSKSRAGRVLMHTKMIVGTITRKSDSGSKKPSRDEDEQETAAGWMYVGSHNFTYAAWGNLTGSGSAPVMNVNNYELGVIVPLNTAEDVDTASAWERPARKYGSGDIPWIMQENR